MRVAAPTKHALLVLCVLAAWVFWLRGPTFARPAWNLDEGIHATIARSILDGGVMYRDAIDQRTPLTYYLVAGIFWIFGENNMWAVHAVVAALIAATALGLFLLGRRWRGNATGLWAALVFCALSTNLCYIGDSYSLCTEWFVAFFSTWSAWWFWRTWDENSFGKAALAGAGFAAAFLCKQPGLLDFGAPLATVAYAAFIGGRRRAETTRQVLGLATGFTGACGLVLAYFAARGALGDLYFYAWSYNLVYYGPETTATDRFLAAVEFIRMLWQHYPLVGVVLPVAGLVLLRRLSQAHPAPGEQAGNPAAFYLVAWTLLAWTGAASAGRVYGHYYFQLLPAGALLTGWLLGDCQAWWRDTRRRTVRWGTGLVLAAAALTVVAGPLRGPWPAILGPETGTDAAAFVRGNSRPADKVFVWGYNPDFYLYADRRAASRYVYCSFLTGLIPWTNTQPERDTAYGIVPGTMETLLRELDANRPEFFIDASLAGYRGFLKYPLAKFPRLAAFVAANYVEVEAWRFRPNGFRVLLLRDAGRRMPRPLAGGAPDGRLAAPSVMGPTFVEPVAVEYEVQAADPAGKLQRLELLADGTPIDSVTFAPVASISTRFTVHFDRLGRGKHQLGVRATTAGGETRTSSALAIECSPESLPPDQRAAFALPVVTPGASPVRMISSFGAQARQETGAMVYYAHAPSVITYELPPNAVRLRGRFGFRPGAYAADNASRTDGAEFVVTWINPEGRRTEFFRRWLRPWEVPADRGEQSLDVALAAAAAGGQLELAITNGPAGSSASDWTYWSDLLLSTSR